jgi:outer membrane lipase/esterase
MSSKLLARLDTRRWLAGAAVVGAGLLASCGGGDQVEPFAPTRILAFGDDLSAIEVDGRKYSINAFRITDATTSPPTESTTELDCTRNPLWIQTVATQFGLAFDRCLGTATAATGQVLAQVGDKVADLARQTLSVQGDALGEKDLALVMIGMNDILEIYAQYPAVGRDVLLDQARVRGRVLGNFVNQLATTGPAVVVLTVPDIGKSPFALAQNVSTGDATRAALITEVVETFNNSMSVRLINDGRLIGLVYADVEIQNMVASPSSYGLVNVVLPACLPTAPLPGCTTSTLVGATPVSAAATSTTWLWADSLRLSPAGQSRLGALAESRARNNPF